MFADEERARLTCLVRRSLSSARLVPVCAEIAVRDARLSSTVSMPSSSRACTEEQQPRSQVSGTRAQIFFSTCIEFLPDYGFSVTGNQKAHHWIGSDQIRSVRDGWMTTTSPSTFPSVLKCPYTCEWRRRITSGSPCCHRARRSLGDRTTAFLLLLIFIYLIFNLNSSEDKKYIC